MTRHLVTGGAGFIGSRLCRRLLNRGDQVTIIDDLSTGRVENLGTMYETGRLSFSQASVSDAAKLTSMVEDSDIVWHLAAAVGVRLVSEDAVRTIDTNIGPTETILQAASRMRKRVFLASTSEVYGKTGAKPVSEASDVQYGPTTVKRWAYAYSKAIDEFLAIGYAHQHGLQVTVGRFFNVVGPGQRSEYGMVIPSMIANAKSGQPIIVHGDGQQVRCFAHVDEVVESILRLMDHPDSTGQVFNIGCDQPVTIASLAKMIIERIGGTCVNKSHESEFGPNFEDIGCRIPDLTKLKSTIGYAPSMSLAAILDDILQMELAA